MSDRAEVWIAPAAMPAEADRRPTWWLRRCFALESLPASLVVDIVCLGYYELYVNGWHIGDEPLAPSISRLDKRGFVLHHEIAAYVRNGRNCIALWTSSGWYLPHQFQVHQEATPLVRISCPDSIAFEGDWLCREANRWILDAWAWNRFGGEEVDARAAVPSWNLVEGDVCGWHSCKAVSPPPIEISERTCPANRIGDVYDARCVRHLADGRIEVDFGICLSGWVNLQLPGLKADQTLTFRFYDLPADDERQKDHSYNQISIYHACGDGHDHFINKFNYAGFRYMTIEGLVEAPALENLRALLVESAMERTGHFRCSNELFNRIHDLNLHTLRCLNLGGYSVDCPHRERNGYGADGQTALPGYLYLLDAQAFLRKWLTDWCDVYEPDTGRIQLTAPTRHAQHAPAWGGIVAPLAWALYVYYGDRAALEYALPVIEGHLRFLQRGVRDGVLRKECLGSAFHGDWVPPGRGMDTRNTPNPAMRELFNSCYLIYLWQIYLQISEVLEVHENRPEAERHIADLQAGVHREFYDENQGLYLLPEQAYQAMPLIAGVVPAGLRDPIRRRLIGLIEAQGWHMDSGLPGTTLLLDLLMQLGEHDVVGKIYAQESYPGWGYMLARGATAIWEQWNGYWSQIHSCFAGPAVWFYAGLAGIQPDASGPGFKRFRLAPAFLKEIECVDAAYDSASGRIESAWRRNGEAVRWRVRIPSGCTASVTLPAEAAATLVLNGQAHPCHAFPLGEGQHEIVFKG